MSEFCYTAAQVKFVRASILAMMGVTVIQALTVARLGKALHRGNLRFNHLHDGAEYLLNIINEHDIELTEFDVIALTSIFDGSNVRS